MNKAGETVLKILIDTERFADKVLQYRLEIIELDKRRQSTREAIRDLGKNDDKNVWITIGPILVKMEKEKACTLLKEDQKTIDAEINKLRSEQKVWVAKLREAECQAPLVGFDLKALDRKEAAAFKANLPGF
ncbi:uncharacterized protein LOC116349513 [Contarinia nasturtii]|uniref:uncharacterized protein LOC116346747 n=1 Tax=Contarinia nasturtii TaxID=265458 RepID=UPI0012D4C00E|nr:uncharacterized protein LOC116346747 [Contarinia nasturtii]XP_031636851.1 uncharacterized protein LOC116349513 [Contarinia nasturtii]